MYTSIKSNGSKNHQSQFKYDPITSAFNSDFAEKNIYSEYFLISDINLANVTIEHPITLREALIELHLTKLMKYFWYTGNKRCLLQEV